MEKRKRSIISILISIIIILLSGCQAFAAGDLGISGELKFSDDYLEYLKLSDEEKEKVIAPRMYDIPKTQVILSNPFKLARMTKSSIQSRFSLKDIIPENMIVKDQKQTNSCWTFASLASLESNLALKDYRYNFENITGNISRNRSTPKVYDFSERHMEYALSETFLDGKNPIGFNREVGGGGIPEMPTTYLTNGTGAIAENDMPFLNNEARIALSEIQGKEVITQVSDIVHFPAYNFSDDKTQIIKQMKEHIMNYGAVNASIHGATVNGNSAVYNKETGALYCKSSTSYPINHAIAVVGWDDNYSRDNFVASNKPSQNGAWIIRNSWGTGIEYTLDEMKQVFFSSNRNYCIQKGWNTYSDIPDADILNIFQNNGYTIENNVAKLKVGDNGFMYVSYADANIYKQSTGIIEAKDEVTYENIYQYDEFGGVVPIKFTKDKIYLASIFDRKSSGAEYLTEVSINASEQYTCKVFVNPNGESKDFNDLQQVQLKAGETETFDAGYHTLEFLEPVKINSDKFAVVLEIQGSQANKMSIMMEFNYGQFVGNDGSVGYIYNNVSIESGKCFYTVEENVSNNIWYDTSTVRTLTGNRWPNFDTTLKAFTTAKVLEEIQITTPPTKTTYIEGQNFDSTGMVVKAKYANGNEFEITDYSIIDGNDLKLGTTEIIITYQGKSTKQQIQVVPNKIEEIKITTPPDKTEYWAGENFDKTGMVVNAVYTDKTTKQITDYVIENGENLKNDQTSVTISYEDKTTTQAITVKIDNVASLEITKAPNKVEYVQGQNFDSTGMTVKAIYESGTEREISDFIVKDGTNLQVDQTKVIIEYEGKTVEQPITVIQKTVTEIKIKTMPFKTEYIVNENLDLTGGEIEISYNDGTNEVLSMLASEITVTGFDNKVAGEQTITLTYGEKTVQFNINVRELEKPENSSFDNIKADVKNVKAYFYSDKTKKENIVINVEINDFKKSTKNEKMEYYYYLSTVSNEQNIANWVKIKEPQTAETQLKFEINTQDISNYQELADAETTYLYVKETATKNNMTSENVSPAMALKVEDSNVERYVDGVKTSNIDSTPSVEGDNTKAPGTIPHAGENIVMIILSIAVVTIGIIAFRKYKDIKLK